MWQGDYRQATVQLEQSLTMARRAGALDVAAQALNNLGACAMMSQFDLNLAEQRLAESIELARAAGDPRLLVRPLGNLGEVAYLRGDLERAAAYHEEALALGRQVGGPSVHVIIANLGNVARRQGDLARAEALCRESIALARQACDLREIAVGLEHLVMVQAAAGQGERAARLLGASGAIREKIGAPLPQYERAEVEAVLVPVRAALGAKAWATACAAGQALSLEEAVALALGEDDGDAACGER